MSELIDREAAIRKIEPWLYSEGRGESELNILRAVIAELKSLPAAPRWVRCEERLPKPGQVCLVYDEDGYMNVATYTGDKYFPTAYGFHVNGEEVTDITHWMPIEPPKEDA